MTEKKIPLRMCIACRQMQPKASLIRIVHTVDGDFKIDVTGRLGGRGCYICGNSDCIKKCVKAKLLNKVFKTNVCDAVYENLTQDYGGC